VNKVLLIVRVLIRGGIPDTPLDFYSSFPIERGGLVWVSIGSSTRVALVLETLPVRHARSRVRGSRFKLKSIKSTTGIVLADDVINILLNYSRHQALPLGKVLDLVLPRLNTKPKPYQITIKLEPRAEIASPNDLLGNYEHRKAKYIDYFKAYCKKNSERMIILSPNINVAKDLAAHFRVNELACEIRGYGSSKEYLAKASDNNNLNINKILIIHPSELLFNVSEATLMIVERAGAPYGSHKLLGYSYKSFTNYLIANTKLPIFYADTMLTLERAQVSLSGMLPPIEYDLIEKEQVIGKLTSSLVGQLNESQSSLLIVIPNSDLGHILVCKECRSLFSCTKCNFPLSLNEKKREGRFYNCGRCRTSYDKSTKCFTCDSWNIKVTSPGRKLLEREIRKVIANRQIALTFVTYNSLSSITKRYDNSIVFGSDYLIGGKYYRSRETLLYKLLSIRSLTDNQMILETKLKNCEFIDKISRGDYITIIEEELALRKHFGYPPYGVIVKLSMAPSSIGIELLAFTREHLSDCEPIIYQAKTTASMDATQYVILKYREAMWPDIKLLEFLKKINSKVKLEVNPNHLR